MNAVREQARKKRKFLPPDLSITGWTDVEPYAFQLRDARLSSPDELKLWLARRSELDAVIAEDKAWLYIRQSCHTDNEEYARTFAAFVQDVEEPYSLLSNELNKKLLAYCKNHTYPKEYEIFIRNIRRQTEIFREENVKLLSELEVEEQQYGSITGAMTISYDGKELTLQQAQNYLKSTDRMIRQKVFELILHRRSTDYEKLDDLYTSLLAKRQRVAENAGFTNYLEYRFAQLGRFDYTIADCENFHQAVETQVVPLLDRIASIRKEKLGLTTLLPYDLEVDTDGKEPLRPFETPGELISKSIACYEAIDPQFGEFIRIMDKNAFLDLDSRKGKAPGGYNYPLHESNIPFIFMNATHNLRDLETMMHEGGHAIHSFLSSDLEFVYYKETPAEIAEVASMAIELISMEHWHYFFDNEDDLKRAHLSQLEGVLKVLPWVATIDKFQHWVYTHPGHSANKRVSAWRSIEGSLSSQLIDWGPYPEYRDRMWQKQIHLFQFPLYYIEYGIAQLGAIGIWKNYKEDPARTIQAYKHALSLGYSKTLPELYEAAGIRFDFSAGYINSLCDFVRNELEGLSK